MTKLQKKLQRQAKQTERLMGNYSVQGKSTTSRQSGFYKPTFADRISLK